MATLSRANEPNSHATLIILRKLKKSRTPTDTHHQDERELNFCLVLGWNFPVISSALMREKWTSRKRIESFDGGGGTRRPHCIHISQLLQVD